MNGGYKAGGRGYLQTVRTADQEKKGRRRRIERGKGRCISPENMSYLRGGEGKQEGGRRDRGRRDGRSSHNSKTFSNNSWPLLRHFSSVSGSERAGRWRGQPLSNVDSQPQSEDV